MRKHFIVEKQNEANNGFQPVKDCKSETEAETLIEQRLADFSSLEKKDRTRFGLSYRPRRSPVYRIEIRYTA